MLVALARAVTEFTDRIVESGHEAGVLRPDLTASDLFWADVANGLALREMRKPRREDYDRRTRQFIDSLRPNDGGGRSAGRRPRAQGQAGIRQR